MCIRYWRRADDYRASILGVVTVLAAAYAGLGIARVLDPMSSRFQLLSVAVQTPVRVGDDARVSVLRRVLSDFQGYSVVTVRRVDNATFACSAAVPISFKAHTPEELARDPVPQVQTLDWWAPGATPPCEERVDSLSPGSFVITACIHDDGGGLAAMIWPRYVCKDSNIFEVIE